ncbi:MAG: hypothetical protein ACK5LP_04255 [Campylobacteraceae bacterium]
MTLHDFLEKDEFVTTVQTSLSQTIRLLLQEDIPFNILVNMAQVSFEPKLPKNISKSFQPITLFALEGYTLASTTLKNGVLSFEAGFGEEDIAAFVSMPIGTILQVSINETPIFLNMSIAKPKQEKEKVEEKKEEVKKSGAKRSMEALLNNPENKNLFKK